MWRKLYAERVDPEQVGELRIADRDVAGHALAEPEPTEHAQRAGELGLAVGALLLDSCERFRQRHVSSVLGVSGIPSIVRTSLSVIAMPQRTTRRADAVRTRP